jgi:hypothetical protein
MTVYKSTLITKREDKSAQIPRGEQTHERVALAGYEAAGVIADNDVVVLCEIPVNARISSLKLWADDLGTTGDLNFGFYAGDADLDSLTDADAVDEDALATAVDVNAAALADVELRFEVKDLSTINDAAWELAGLSSAPAYGTFLIAATASEATTAAGGIAIAVRYTE